MSWTESNYEYFSKLSTLIRRARSRIILKEDDDFFVWSADVPKPITSYGKSISYHRETLGCAVNTFYSYSYASEIEYYRDFFWMIAKDSDSYWYEPKESPEDSCRFWVTTIRRPPPGLLDCLNPVFIEQIKNAAHEPWNEVYLLVCKSDEINWKTIYENCVSYLQQSPFQKYLQDILPA